MIEYFVKICANETMHVDPTSCNIFCATCFPRLNTVYMLDDVESSLTSFKSLIQHRPTSHESLVGPKATALQDAMTCLYH